VLVPGDDQADPQMWLSSSPPILRSWV
jgi:hypothetical protein